MNVHRISTHFSFVLFLFLLSSCAFNERIADHAIKYNKTVEEAHNAQILLNILRARDRHPMHFTAISLVRGRLTAETSGSLSVRIPLGGDAADVFPLTPSLTVNKKSSPSFDVSILDTQEFMSGILTPVEMTIFKYYWDQRWPKELLLYLLIHKVEEGGKDAINSPEYEDPDREDPFDLFKGWIKRVHPSESESQDYKLSIVEITKGNPVGPPVGLTDSASIEHLVKAVEAKLKVVEVPKDSGLYRLCKITTTVKFCLGPKCPKSDLISDCTKDKEPTDPESKGVTETIGKKATVHFRSVQGIIYYLGEVLREEKDGVKIRWGPKYEDKILFSLTTNRWAAAKPTISVDYDGKTYYVPAGEEGGVTTTVLSLITQLIALHKVRKELPTTTAVETVGQ